jgi:transcriptional regulator with XRE-family HTH domain
VAVGENTRLELARFLRKRRARLSPHEVGIPAGAGRRRTPGLRREEVAVLAGISTTWYTYLEQGRGREVSPAVLDSIARVLILTEDERRYMHQLMFGHISSPGTLHEVPERQPVPGGVLTQMDVIARSYPYPAYIADRACDLLAWNDAAAEWYDDWERLTAVDRNFMLWVFTADEARRRFVDWEQIAHDLVARWRAEVAKWPRDDAVQRRIAQLSKASPAFAGWWAEHDVLEHRVLTRRLRHPEFGIGEWTVIPLATAYRGEPGVMFHLPAHEDET